MQRAAIYIRIRDIDRTVLMYHRDPGLCRPVLCQRQYIIRQTADIKGFMGQLDLTVLQLAHIQHIIDQRQQMAGRYPGLFTVLCQLRGCRLGHLRNVQTADDAV